MLSFRAFKMIHGETKRNGRPQPRTMYTVMAELSVKSAMKMRLERITDSVSSYDPLVHFRFILPAYLCR